MNSLRGKCRLRYWRRARGYTQEEIGRLLAVHATTVSRWELAVTAPTREQAERLASLLRVRVSELFPFVAKL